MRVIPGAFPQGWVRGPEGTPTPSIVRGDRCDAK
jgi:hypothetical protein